MVDTSRTKSQLLTSLFVDGQANGSITAGDIRDLIVSLSPACGGIYVSSPAVTTIGSSGVFVLGAGTTTLLSAASEVDMPQNNRLRYTGSVQRAFMVDVSFTVTVSGNDQDTRYQLAKNGSLLVETIVARKFAQGADKGSLSMNTQLALNTDDYIEMFVTNDTSTGDITIENMTITMIGFII